MYYVSLYVKDYPIAQYGLPDFPIFHRFLSKLLSVESFLNDIMWNQVLCGPSFDSF
jgi:hypothetical protein